MKKLNRSQYLQSFWKPGIFVCHQMPVVPPTQPNPCGENRQFCFTNLICPFLSICSACSSITIEIRVLSNCTGHWGFCALVLHRFTDSGLCSVLCAVFCVQLCSCVIFCVLSLQLGFPRLAPGKLPLAMPDPDLCGQGNAVQHLKQSLENRSKNVFSIFIFI